MKTLTKYDILVVVSNRLYLVLVIGLHTRYGVQIPIYLERGRKLFLSLNKFLLSITVQIPIYLERGRKLCINSHVFPPFVAKSIDTYLPREGTETVTVIIRISFGHRIDTYLPREGTETYEFFLLKLISFFVQIPIYFERGRKLLRTLLGFLIFLFFP